RHLAVVIAQVPPDAVETGGAAHRQRADHRARGVVDGDGGAPGRGQVEVDVGAVGRVLSDHARAGLAQASVADAAETVGGARGIEHLRGAAGLVGAQGGNVVHDPVAAAVGRDHQVVEVRLHGDPVHRRCGHVVVQFGPVAAIVPTDVDRVVRAQV